MAIITGATTTNRDTKVIVKRGDTINSVSKRAGRNPRKVLRDNPGIKRLRPGQVLNIRPEPSGGIGQPTAGPPGVKGLASLRPVNRPAYTPPGGGGIMGTTRLTSAINAEGVDQSRYGPSPFTRFGESVGNFVSGMTSNINRNVGNIVGALRTAPTPFDQPEAPTWEAAARQAQNRPYGPPTPPGYITPTISAPSQRGPTDMESYMRDRARIEQANLQMMVDRYRGLAPLIDAGIYQVSDAELRDMQRFGLITRSAAEEYRNQREGLAGGGGGGGRRGGRRGGGQLTGTRPSTSSYARSAAYTGLIHWRL